MYDEKLIILYERKFNFNIRELKNVSLWNFDPVWPRSKSESGGVRLTGDKLVGQISNAYYKSLDDGHLVLWMPAAELHRAVIDPANLETPWKPQATILSGTSPIYVGYIFAKQKSYVDWATTFIPDERSKRGPSSSKSMKFLLEKLVPNDRALVVDPYPDRSAVLPIWCRRMLISYVGYAGSKSVYQDMKKKLAQVELPGIQLSMPITEEG